MLMARAVLPFQIVDNNGHTLVTTVPIRRIVLAAMLFAGA